MSASLGWAEIPGAVRAFEALAPVFDERFGRWESVAAQRRAVRRQLLETFPPGAALLELNAGTGEDALFLAARGRKILVTDGAAGMVARTREKAQAAGCAGRVSAREVLLEDLDRFAESLDGTLRFDGAYSNFSGLNCIADLSPVARGLARLLPPKAHALLVIFGPLAPGEVLIELAKARPRDALRRLSGSAAARLGDHGFRVFYHTPGAVARRFAPCFRLARTRGIGIFVPPSAAEPTISRFPGLVRFLEAIDRWASIPLALLGDHVLLDLVRTDARAASGPGS